MGLIFCSSFPHRPWKKTYRFRLSQAWINSLFARKTGVAAYWNPNIALINLLMKSIAPHHAGLITVEEEILEYFHTLKK